MATVRECIEAFERSQATRPADRPINVIRVAHLKTAAWRQDAESRRHVARGKRPSWKRPDLWRGDSLRCRTLADTGEHLAIERVGLVVPDGRAP